MIILGLIFLLVVVPSLAGALSACIEWSEWRTDKAIAKQLNPQFGRDIYHGGPLWLRVKNAFAEGCWSSFFSILSLIILGLILWVLWLIFRD